jgi:elongation factor Ts
LNLFADSLDELLASEFEGVSLKDKVLERVAAIGEKIELANYEKIEAPMVVSYIHMGNKAGVVLGLNKEG